MLSRAQARSEKHPEIRYGIANCLLGKVLVAQSQDGICAILLGDGDEDLLLELRNIYPKAIFICIENGFMPDVEQVVHYVEAPWTALNLPLDLQGTPFQKRVWKALQGIPVGEKITYADLARRIGAAKSARAVGQACAANRLAVAVPCHRAVSQNGDLTGFRWGLKRKKLLLEMEAQFLSSTRKG